MKTIILEPTPSAHQSPLLIKGILESSLRHPEALQNRRPIEASTSTSVTACPDLQPRSGSPAGL